MGLILKSIMFIYNPYSTVIQSIAESIQSSCDFIYDAYFKNKYFKRRRKTPIKKSHVQT